jgi:hypothetical protein
MTDIRERNSRLKEVMAYRSIPNVARLSLYPTL